MGKSSFRFGPGRGGGRAGCGRPYRELAAPPFLLLTPLGIGRRRRRAGSGGQAGILGGLAGAASGLRTGYRPGPLSPGIVRGANPLRYVWSAARGQGRPGRPAFFVSRDVSRHGPLLTVFQLSRPEGGLSAFPGTSRSRGGGIGRGRRGKGGTATRAQASEVATGLSVQQIRK